MRGSTATTVFFDKVAVLKLCPNNIQVQVQRLLIQNFPDLNDCPSY